MWPVRTILHSSCYPNKKRFLLPQLVEKGGDKGGQARLILKIKRAQCDNGKSYQLFRKLENCGSGSRMETNTQRLEIIQQRHNRVYQTACLVSSRIPNVPVSRMHKVSAICRAKASSRITTASDNSSASARTSVSPLPRSVIKGKTAALAVLVNGKPLQ
jgi:hypothetical protein